MYALVLGCSVEPLDPNLEENLNATVQQSQGNPHEQFGIPQVEQGDASESSLTVNITAAENGATGGLSVRWMTYEEYDEFGWSNGNAGHALLNGHANDEYSLDEGETFYFHLENYISEEGDSWNRALACDQTYVFIAQAHQDGKMQKSDYSQPFILSTVSCEPGDDPCAPLKKDIFVNQCAEEINRPTEDGLGDYYKAQIIARSNGLPTGGTFNPTMAELLVEYEAAGGIGVFSTNYTVNTSSCGEITIEVSVNVYSCNQSDDPCAALQEDIYVEECAEYINRPTEDGFFDYYKAQIIAHSALPTGGDFDPDMAQLVSDFEAAGGIGIFSTNYSVETESCGEITIEVSVDVSSCSES
jgi:hypothetical protein